MCIYFLKLPIKDSSLSDVMISEIKNGFLQHTRSVSVSLLLKLI